MDESDFVKNDGTRIFVLSGRTLFTATSWPPQSLAVAGKLEIECIEFDLHATVEVDA